MVGEDASANIRDMAPDANATSRHAMGAPSTVDRR
jgi:hypothetical protein